jgi:signal transduction histidine kinase
VIERAAQDGRETVRRIQEFSRTRRDKHFQNVSLHDVIRDALEMTKTHWKNEALRREAKVTAAFDGQDVPPILGNASELREVFTNLILNAVDAMPKGGRLELSCKREGDRVLATVKDTGIGMSEGIRQNIFDPFFTTKGAGGMGLGMSVVYGIVTRHGGRIDVETALGKGTTFLLEFPVSKEREVVLPGNDGAMLPQVVVTGRILVVDDEPDVAEVVADVLATAGHQVDMAPSGTRALR